MKKLRIVLFLVVAATFVLSFGNNAFADKQVVAKPPVSPRTHHVHFRGYRPYFGFGFHYSPFYYPYYYSPYYYPYGFGYGYGRPYGAYYYRGYGEVRTEVKPKEAKVYVDGDYVGDVDSFDGWWQRLNLEPGRHRIVFRAPGYQPYAVTLRVLPGEDYKIKQQLQPGQDSIPENEMRLPDREYDRDRYRDRDYNDQYRDRNYKPDYDRNYDYDRNNNDQDRDYNSDQNRDYNSDQDYQNNPQFEEERNDSDKHTLMLQIEPSDATIYVDGTYYGTADVNRTGEVQVLLPAGVHRIEVVRPGYESYTKELNVTTDSQQERIVISLKKK